MQLKEGSATVPVAAIGVPPMASAQPTPNQMVNRRGPRSGRRDADQCGRDARAPRNEPDRSVLGRLLSHRRLAARPAAGPFDLHSLSCSATLSRVTARIIPPRALTRPRASLRLTSFLATLVIGATTALAAAEEIGVGKPAPEITGKDIEGKTFALSQHRGKVVLLTFWGDW